VRNESRPSMLSAGTPVSIKLLFTSGHWHDLTNSILHRKRCEHCGAQDDGSGDGDGTNPPDIRPRGKTGNRKGDREEWRTPRVHSLHHGIEPELIGWPPPRVLQMQRLVTSTTSYTRDARMLFRRLVEYTPTTCRDVAWYDSRVSFDGYCIMM
jgi:hypothetical protein